MSLYSTLMEITTTRTRIIPAGEKTDKEPIRKPNVPDTLDISATEVPYKFQKLASGILKVSSQKNSVHLSQHFAKNLLTYLNTITPTTDQVVIEFKGLKFSMKKEFFNNFKQEIRNFAS